MALGPLAQLHISVTDVDRSVEFYRDVLQIPFLFRVPGQPMAFLQTGQVRLYLGVPESEKFKSHNVLYFAVDDIDAEQARLEAAGLAFEGKPHVVNRTEDSELWMTFTKDPDGHQIGLMQEKPRL
jgi:predicted enzyme related to lactoylglutathione lyase